MPEIFRETPDIFSVMPEILGETPEIFRVTPELSTETSELLTSPQLYLCQQHNFSTFTPFSEDTHPFYISGGTKMNLNRDLCLLTDYEPRKISPTTNKNQ